MMKINFTIDWGDVGAFFIVITFYVGVLAGLGAIAWELEMLRTDKEPQRVEVTHIVPQSGGRVRTDSHGDRSTHTYGGISCGHK